MLRLVLVVHYVLDRIKRLIASTSDAVRNVFVVKGLVFVRRQCLAPYPLCQLNIQRVD